MTRNGNEEARKVGDFFATLRCASTENVARQREKVCRVRIRQCGPRALCSQCNDWQQRESEELVDAPVSPTKAQGQC